MARLTREDYLAAGLAILGDAGSEALTIAALCEKLQITKGSFYHHFDGMPAFEKAVLEFWEEQHSTRLIAALEARRTDPMWLIPELTEIAVQLPHTTEAAIRSWGKSNPGVAAIQARVDVARRERILHVLHELGLDKGKATLLTDIAVCVLVGFQHTAPNDIDRLHSMLDEVNRLIFLEATN